MSVCKLVHFAIMSGTQVLLQEANMSVRFSINQSINILFYVCSHRGDIRQKQKHIIIIYTNFPTGL